jgi:hypothetical protein
VRIVTWNCGMALARKAPNLLALNLDIAVVQECSKKSVDVLHGHGLSGLWFGANPNKGLAVYCSKEFTVHAADEPFGKCAALTHPCNGTPVPPCCPQEILRTLCFFVTEKQPTSSAIGSRTSFRPGECSAFHGALLRQLPRH